MLKVQPNHTPIDLGTVYEQGFYLLTDMPSIHSHLYSELLNKIVLYHRPDMLTGEFIIVYSEVKGNNADIGRIWSLSSYKDTYRGVKVNYQILEAEVKYI